MARRLGEYTGTRCLELWLPIAIAWAWCESKRGVTAEKHQSELAMASSLLERMIVTDRVVTGDALYCQRQLCEQVVGGGGDYLLIVKSNQKRLYEDIELCFETPVVGETYGYAETEDSHGERREYRRLWATDTLKTYLEWPGHGQVMKVESWRSIKGKTTRQVRYAITSLGTHTPADRLLQLVRDHWRIENGLRTTGTGCEGRDHGGGCYPKCAPAQRHR